MVFVVVVVRVVVHVPQRGRPRKSQHGRGDDTSNGAEH